MDGNSPTVTMEINASVSKILIKIQIYDSFYAGYGRYCLENNYSTDALKAIRLVLRVPSIVTTSAATQKKIKHYPK
jgi:hypothetical protein